MLKILHSADWHVRDSDFAEISKCLAFMVKVARQEEPDLIVVAGDITDSQNTKLDSKSTRLIFSTVANLASIAPVAIVVGTPFHDGLTPEILSDLKTKHGVFVSAVPTQITLANGKFDKYGNEPDAIISMFPAVTKQYFQSELGIQDTDNAIAQAMGGIFGGFGAGDVSSIIPHILIGHWAVGGAFLSNNQQLTGRELEVSREQISMAQADLVCLGHIHLPQQIGSNIFYSGSIYRKDFGELEDKGFYIHEIDADHRELNGFGVTSRFINTPTRKLLKLEGDFTKGNFDDAENEMYTFKYMEIEDAIVRVEITVYQDEAEKVEQDGIEKYLYDSGAALVDIRLIRIPRANVRSERFFELKTLKDKLAEQALIRGEDELSAGILAKAEQLETQAPEEIYKGLASD